MAEKFIAENEECFHVSVTGVWLSRLKSRNRQRSFFKSIGRTVKIFLAGLNAEVAVKRGSVGNNRKNKGK